MSGMKISNMNKIIKLGILSLMVSVVGSSCIKSVSTGTDFSSLKPTVLIADGGIANFSSTALLFPPTDATDTTSFFVNYASTTTAPQDEVISIAIDDAALAAYNALGGPQYAKFPDSIYSFTTTSVTVPKGANYSSAVPLAMFPSKIDLTQNYMLPISIKTAPAGSTIAANYTTIYYHLIGNPIAGVYKWDWTRWNNATGTGAPTASSFVGHTTVLAPIDATTVTVAAGYYIGPRYIITFTNNNGVLSNFQVSFNPTDIATMTAAGVNITNGPNIIIADPINGVYQFQFNAQTPADRYLVDKYYK
jgi:hypothetical protein